MYHTALSRHVCIYELNAVSRTEVFCILQLQELIQNGLEGNEYVSMLSWVLNTYSGQELMGNPELNIDKQKIGPLLSASVLSRLQDQYLKVK